MSKHRIRHPATICTSGHLGDSFSATTAALIYETFQVALITPPTALVYRSQRGRTSLTWSLVLEPADSEPGRTRVFLRLRMAPVRHKLLARTAGELIDLLTVAGMAAGLAERLRGHDGAT